MQFRRFRNINFFQATGVLAVLMAASALAEPHFTIDLQVTLTGMQAGTSVKCEAKDDAGEVVVWGMKRVIRRASDEDPGSYRGRFSVPLHTVASGKDPNDAVRYACFLVVHEPRTNRGMVPSRSADREYVRPREGTTFTPVVRGDLYP